MSNGTEMIQVGIRIPKPSRDGYIRGDKTIVYDANTGQLLPVSKVDLHIEMRDVISATVTLWVAEVTIEDNGD